MSLIDASGSTGLGSVRETGALGAVAVGLGVPAEVILGPELETTGGTELLGEG